MNILKGFLKNFVSIVSVISLILIIVCGYRIYCVGTENDYVDCDVHTFVPKRVKRAFEHYRVKTGRHSSHQATRTVYWVVYDANDKSRYQIHRRFKERSDARGFLRTAEPVDRRIFEFKKDGKTENYMDVDVSMTASDVLASERRLFILVIIPCLLYLFLFGTIKYVCYRKKLANSKSTEKAFESKAQAKADNSGSYKEHDSFNENSAANESVNVNAKVKANENVGKNDMNAENAHSQEQKASSSKRYKRKSGARKRRDEYFARSKKDDGNNLM